jgi:nicotinate-nucleotide adenylyltransferase
VQKALRYGILGGTFDPPHLGHLILAQEAYIQLNLDKVWFVPAGQPPHKAGQEITPAEVRSTLVALAIEGDERFGLCGVELERSGPSYTVDTLRELRRVWGAEVWICLILGWDMMSSLAHWHDPGGLLEQVDQFAAAPRPGSGRTSRRLDRLTEEVPGLKRKLEVLQCPQVDISATALRKRVTSAQSIRYLVPDAVWDYIAKHDLYLSPVRGKYAGGEPTERTSVL